LSEKRDSSSTGASLGQLEQPPIFVVGAARSGTTWVYDILTAHPQVAGVYESWLFTRNNGLGALYASAHWPPNRSGLSGLLEREALLEETRALAGRLLGRALEPEHRFLVEKSPSHVFAVPLIHELFPRSRFIHVLRDGRDVSVSVRAAARSWVPQWREAFGRSVLTSARAWSHAVRRARKLGADLGDQFLEVRFEEIKREPFASYRRLFDFCGISYDEPLLQQIHEQTDFATNYRSNEEGFRRGGRVGDWRTHFNILDAVQFNLAAGDTLIETGYEENRRWAGSVVRKTSPAR
jgi:protein-tyrosine sulfotransferase